MKLGSFTLCGDFNCDIRLQKYALSAVLRGMRSHRRLPCLGFPVLFRRPFVVFGRKHANGSNMNSRINTLLGIFRLEGRWCLEGTDAFLTCDFNSVDDALDEPRRLSFDYPNKALVH